MNVQVSTSEGSNVGTIQNILGNKRVDDVVPVPQIFMSLRGTYEYINCEYIDDKLVEVHLRQNSDMGDSNEIIPVWEGDPILPPIGFEYVENRDYKRIGFYKNKYNNN